jgi:hypothetical protein
MRTYLLAILILATAACGGDKKPPKSADDVPAPASTEAPKEDMPAPSKDAFDPTTPPGTDTAAATPSGVITVAPFKLVPAKKNAKALELKSDGSVVADGKTVATIKGDQVNEPSGMTMVTVGIDGSLVGQNVKPGWKFSGDELANDDGSKIAVGDDGAITATKKDGKSETLGKIEGGTTAKRAALLSVLLWVSTPAAAAPPPAAAKPAAKPAAAKPAAAKPKK